MEQRSTTASGVAVSDTAADTVRWRAYKRPFEVLTDVLVFAFVGWAGFQVTTLVDEEFGREWRALLLGMLVIVLVVFAGELGDAVRRWRHLVQCDRCVDEQIAVQTSIRRQAFCVVRAHRLARRRRRHGRGAR